MRLLRFFFILIISLFPLGEIIRLGLGNGIAIKPIDVGIGIITAVWLVNKIIEKKSIKPQRILVPTILFIAIAALSLLVNLSTLNVDQTFVSSMYLVRWISYAGIFFFLIDSEDNYKKVIKESLLIIGSLIVVFGYLQYFLYPNLRNLYYLGWDEHMHRMFSVFLDPNFAGIFFALFLLFLLSNYLKNRSVPMGILVLLDLGAIFLTFSRSALIMLIISVSLWLILINKKRLILLLLLVVGCILIISSRYFNIENINLFRVVSSEARLETAKNALFIISKNPILGIGFNAYRYAQIRYGLRNQPSEAISHADAGVDNSLLFVMATTGIIGFLLYIFMWERILISVYRDPLAISSIVGVFVSSMFTNSLFYPWVMLWLWIILALSIKSHN